MCIIWKGSLILVVSGLCEYFFPLIVMEISYNGFHSAPRKVQSTSDLFITFSSFFPSNNSISKLHWQFLCPHDSRTNLICCCSCKLFVCVCVCECVCAHCALRWSGIHSESILPPWVQCCWDWLQIHSDSDHPGQVTTDDEWLNEITFNTCVLIVSICIFHYDSRSQICILSDLKWRLFSFLETESNYRYTADNQGVLANLTLRTFMWGWSHISNPVLCTFSFNYIYYLLYEKDLSRHLTLLDPRRVNY